MAPKYPEPRNNLARLPNKNSCLDRVRLAEAVALIDPSRPRRQRLYRWRSRRICPRKRIEDCFLHRQIKFEPTGDCSFVRHLPSLGLRFLVIAWALYRHSNSVGKHNVNPCVFSETPKRASHTPARIGHGGRPPEPSTVLSARPPPRVGDRYLRARFWCLDHR